MLLHTARRWGWYSLRSRPFLEIGGAQSVLSALAPLARGLRSEPAVFVASGETEERVSPSAPAHSSPLGLVLAALAPFS